MLTILMVLAFIVLALLAGWALVALYAKRTDDIERSGSGKRPPGSEGLPHAALIFDAHRTANDDPAHRAPHYHVGNVPLVPWSPGIHMVGGIQTTQRTLERLGRPGQPYDPLPIMSITRIAEVACRPGQLALRTSTAALGGKGAKIPVAAAAADPDGFKTNIGTTTGIQTFTGTDFQGAIGTAHLLPGRNVVLVLSSHADWDATTAVVTGEDIYGRVVTENLTIPNGGNATVTGAVIFTKIISLVIPAQSGTGGTATFGTGTLLGSLTSRDVLGLIRYLAARSVQAPDTDAAEYAAYDTLAVITKGGVWLSPEVAVTDGQQVYVRFVVNGPLAVGGFTNADDGTSTAPNCVPVIGMRWRGNSETRDSVIMAVADCDFPNI